MPEAAPPPPGEVLRRTLLILVTTLVVARPVVLGEDPGMLSDLSDPTSMVLTLLWFAAAVGWAIWHLLARRGGGEAGGQPWWQPSGAAVVEVALLATVLLVFLSTRAAAYKHPAWLISWDWLGLFVAFFVVRRLAARSADQQGLTTVLLAGAVALSAHGVYQDAFELPRLRNEFSEERSLRSAGGLFMQNSPLGFAAWSSYAAQGPLETLRAAMARKGLYLEPDDPYLAQLRRRALDRHVFGPYAHPNSFAGVLALLLPGLVGAAWFCFRARSPRWRSALVLGCALLTGCALLLTHSRGAILALLLVGLVVGAVAGWPFWRGHRAAVAAVLLALAGAGYGVYASGLWTAGIGKESRTAALRLDYWRLTWQIIASKPWLGVGPGNFGPAYTRVMDAKVEEPIKDPHDFALEVWATSGVFALLALLATLAAYFFVVGRGVWGMGPLARRASEGPPPGGAEAEPPLRWEYYVGGMFGLLLGFVLRAGEGQSGDVVGEGIAAGVRSVAWFGAFALLESVPWTARGRALALAAGAAALLLNLTVSGGISFPSVAGPLWVVMAVALAAVTPEREGKEAASPAARFLPLPVFAALALSYLVYVFTPVTTGRDLVKKGDEAGQKFLEQIAKNPAASYLRPFRVFKDTVTGPLDEAAKENPDDARIQAVRGNWYGQLWRLELMAGIDHRDAVREAETAVKAAVRAQQLDPKEARGYLAEYHLHELFAEMLQLVADKQADKTRKGELEDQVREEYRRGAGALDRHVPDDPANPVLRYRIAEALFKAGDQAAGKEAAEASLALDLRLKGTTRSLTDPQRKELRRRLGLSEGG